MLNKKLKKKIEQMREDQMSKITKISARDIPREINLSRQQSKENLECYVITGIEKYNTLLISTIEKMIKVLDNPPKSFSWTWPWVKGEYETWDYLKKEMEKLDIWDPKYQEFFNTAREHTKEKPQREILNKFKAYVGIK